MNLKAIQIKVKRVFLAAILLAGSAGLVKAQNYSANVIGYVSVPLTNGYTMVANQLDYDGTGTNNTILSCLGTNLPNNLQVLVWLGSGYQSVKWSSTLGRWTANNSYVTNAMQPGTGFFCE